MPGEIPHTAMSSGRVEGTRGALRADLEGLVINLSQPVVKRLMGKADAYALAAFDYGVEAGRAAQAELDYTIMAQARRELAALAGKEQEAMQTSEGKNR